MDIKFWTPAMIGFFLAVGSLQAYADSSLGFDEDTETVIYNFSGSSVPQPSSPYEGEYSRYVGDWYYDDLTETIAFMGEGSRGKHVRDNPSTDVSPIDYELAFLDQ